MLRTPLPFGIRWAKVEQMKEPKSPMIAHTCIKEKSAQATFPQLLHLLLTNALEGSCVISK